MTTTAMNVTYINALLADAAYVNDLDQANINSMLAARLTQPLADFITQNFDVLDQEIALSDGFSQPGRVGKSCPPFILNSCVGRTCPPYK